MNNKTQKIISRIGAGLMLGLSLLNLGAAWNKQQASQLPKQARQIRKRELEQLKPQAQQIAQIAEQEGKLVLQQQAEQKAGEELALQTLSTSQLVLRTVAVTIWTATAAVFFSSMIFNSPLALGKLAMALLPGIPHTASLSLKSAATNIKYNQLAEVNLQLNSEQDLVHLVRTEISYDPSLIEFDHYEVDPKIFDKVKKIDSSEGTFILSLENSQADRTYSRQTVAKVFFKAKSQQSKVSLDINQAGSVVLSLKNQEYKNILGKTSSTRLTFNR